MLIVLAPVESVIQVTAVGVVMRHRPAARVSPLSTGANGAPGCTYMFLVVQVMYHGVNCRHERTAATV